VGEGQDGGGFAGAGGAVEEEVGEVGGVQGALEEVGGVRLGGYVGEGFGAAGQVLVIVDLVGEGR